LSDLAVVSERSAEDIIKQRATLALKFSLINLTANLIRVVRGAGKPDRIVDYIDGFVDAFNEYYKVIGHAPTGAMLSDLIRFPDRADLKLDDDRLDEMLLEDAICRSALQMVASTLMEQRIHQEEALGELQGHLRRFVDVRERAKKRRARTRRAAAPKPLKP
jgi:hypothetical protein